MNILQRIILIVGAIVFVVVLLTSPKVMVFKGTKMVSSLGLVDPGTALVRGFAVLGVTVLLFFATKGKKKD